MRRRLLRVLVVAGVLTGSVRGGVTPAVAGEAGARATAVREARAHLAAADRAFRKARYDEALAQVQAAYAADPRPEFLIVFAQIYRAKGLPQRAVEACELYLAAAPDGARAEEARALAAAARGELAAGAAADAPATGAAPLAVKSGAAPLTLEAPAAVPSAPVLTVDAAGQSANVVTPPRRRRRTGLWVGLGVGSAAAVGLALGLGLGFGLHHSLPHISFDPGSPP